MRLSYPARLLLAALALASMATAVTARGPRKSKPWTATGRVVDVHGRPVAGAAIELSITNQEYKSVAIGQGVSGADGRFALRLTTNDYGDAGLGVEAPGFAHWGWVFDRGVVNEKIVLRRAIDLPFIEGLRKVRDPGERARTTEPRDRRDDTSPADRAARLLAYWADPADDALVLPWIKKNWGARPAHVKHLGLSGASIYQVCDRWREIHFDDQGISGPQPWSSCLQPVLDRTGNHALTLFRVRYANWGYEMDLVMRRDGERWVLRGVNEGAILHFRR